jgi:hypothetical protein
MEPLPIQRRFGDRAIGLINEGNGFGSQVIGQGLQDLMATGCPAIGNPVGEVGCGEKATGTIVK